jgi:hypothetical protein
MRSLLVFVAIGCGGRGHAREDAVPLAAPKTPTTETTTPTKPGTPAPAVTRALARCCGTERATLGPLFGHLALGIADHHDEDECAHPAPFCALEGLGVEVLPTLGTGKSNLYIDRVEVEIPEATSCTEIERRLLVQWGPRDGWFDRQHRQRATLAWHGTTTCTLTFERVGALDPAHCRDDERPGEDHLVDGTRRCLGPDTPRSCVLDRMTAVQDCVVDPAHHTWLTASPRPDDRPCSPTELNALGDFRRACPK